MEDFLHVLFHLKQSFFRTIFTQKFNTKVKRFIFASSSSIYGDSTELPKKEEYIGKPLSPYALKKCVNELYADVFAKTYGIEYIGLRYFNVYGRRQDLDSLYAAVIPLFIKQYLNHKRPQINGNGQNTRDFTYIDNVIYMNMLALNTTNPSAVNQIYNTAGEESISINQLAFDVKSCLLQYDSSIFDINPIYGECRIGDIPHSFACIEKAIRLLNYSPLVSFQKD